LIDRAVGLYVAAANFPIQRPKFKPVVVVLILAALLRAVVLGVLSNHLDRASRPDTASYEYFASHLWSDLWSPNPTELYETLQRTPGYPLILAALGEQTLAVLVAQVAMSLVLVVVVYRLALESVGEAGAIFAAAVVAFEPSGLAYDFFLLSEAAFALALTLGIALWLLGLRRQSWRWLAAAGVVLGLATLIRPVSLYLLVVLLPITAVRMRKHGSLFACLVLAVAFALPVGTWVARNVVLTGHPVFSTIQAYDLAYYRGPYAIAAEDHVTLDQATKSVLASVTATDLDPVAKADQLSRAGTAALLSHPKGWVEITAKGAVFLLLGSGDSEWRGLLGVHTPVTTALDYAVSFALLVLALGGAVFALRGRQWELIAVASVVAYVVAVSSGGESNSRMRVPIEPLIALLAAYAVVTLRRGWAARRDPDGVQPSPQ
jgi:4-amino-4-deoxy-L-arabinose transferase-like glycosyltransferase